jgi:uncharacterized protein (DUF1330 family)
MPAYMIVNVDVRDPVVYEEYKNNVPALVKKHGGEYLARGGRFVVLEGDWKPSRLAVFRFPDVASAQSLYNDPDYQPLKALRQRVSKMDVVVVEGL